MKVALVFAPYSNPLWPYLGCPALTGYLQQQGIDVAQRDLNIDFFSTLLTKAYMEDCYISAEKKVKKFSELKKLKSLNMADEYVRLVEAISMAKYPIENVERAVNILKDPREIVFEDHAYRRYKEVTSSNVQWANDVLSQAFALASAAYYPTQFHAQHLRMSRSCYNISDVQKLGDDYEENPFIKWYESNVIPWLDEYKPQVFGLSVSLGSQLIPSFTLARLVKKKFPDMITVMGGEVITKAAKGLAKESCKEIFNDVDIFVSGEGEGPLLKITEIVSNGSNDFSSVPSSISTLGNKVTANWKEQRVPMNSLPAPSYDGISFDSYIAPVKKASIRLSRGCYWAKCTFCTYDDMEGPIAFNVRDADKVVEDILSMHERYGIPHFYFVDEALPPKSMIQLSDLLLEKDARITYEGLIRFEKSFSLEVLSKMKRSGCVKMVLGLESTNERVAKKMKKGNDNDEVARILRDMKRVGIISHAGVIVGFPTETKDEAQETYDFVAKHIDYFFGAPMFWDFQLETTSPVFSAQSDHKIEKVIPKDLRKDSFDYIWNYQCSSGMSQSETLALAKEFSSNIEELFMKKHYKAHVEDTEKHLDSGSNLTRKTFKISEYAKVYESAFELEILRKALKRDHEDNREYYLDSDGYDSPISNPFSVHNPSLNIQRDEKTYIVNVKNKTIEPISSGILEHILELCKERVSYDQIVDFFKDTVRKEDFEKLTQLVRRHLQLLIDREIVTVRTSNYETISKRREKNRKSGSQTIELPSDWAFK